MPDALSALGTPIDLARIETPCYIQAGREDHIAPPESVWKLTRHLARAVDLRAGRIGPYRRRGQSAGGEQIPVLDQRARRETLGRLRRRCERTPGQLVAALGRLAARAGPGEVPAKGKRKPGGKGDKVIEDAPGRYVMTR